MNELNILKEFSDILQIASIWSMPFKWIGWEIIKLLAFVVDSVSDIADKMFVLDIFFNKTEVISFVDKFKPIIGVLFAVSIVFVGYRVMFSKNKNLQSVGINIIISLIVIFTLPSVMDKMTEITKVSVSFVKEGENNQEENYANKIIKDNVTDILLYDKNNFRTKDLNPSNNISTENIRTISPLEVIDPSEYDLENKEVFKNKINIAPDGSVEKAELKTRFFGMDENYERYKISFFYIIISLGIVAIAQVFTAFKLGRIIFELAYHKLLALIVAPLDIDNGQRTKQLIQHIISTFFVTILISALLKFYTIFVTLCSDIGGAVGIILLISGSLAVIDGPNIVEKLFGIDAGIQSGFKMIAGTYAGARAMGAMGKLPVNMMKTGSQMAGKVTGATATTGAGAAGLSKGLYNGLKTTDKKDGDEEKSGSLYSELNNNNQDMEKDNKNSLYDNINSNESSIPSSLNYDNQVQDTPIDSNQVNNVPDSISYDKQKQDSSVTSNKTETNTTPKANDMNKPSIKNNMSSSKRLSNDNKATTNGDLPIQSNVNNDGLYDNLSESSKSSSSGHINDNEDINKANGVSNTIGHDTQAQGTPTNSNKTSSIPNSMSYNNQVQNAPINSSKAKTNTIPIANNMNKPNLGDNISSSKVLSNDNQMATNKDLPTQNNAKNSALYDNFSEGSQSSLNSSINNSKSISSNQGNNVRENDSSNPTTLEQAIGGAIKSKITDSNQYKNMKKAYGLSRNTGENLSKKLRRKVK